MFTLLKWRKHEQQQETQNIYLALETEQILQNNCMFVCVHSTQKKNW